MSFDLHLEHFVAGESTSIDYRRVAAVLALERYTEPQPGYYDIDFVDGSSVEFSASGLDGREPTSGCAFHIRGVGPKLFDFVFDIAQAGDFVIFNCQGDDSPESPVVILVRSGQESELPASLLTQYQSRPLCTSGTMLAGLLFPDFEEWEEYRDRIIGK